MLLLLMMMMKENIHPDNFHIIVDRYSPIDNEYHHKLFLNKENKRLEMIRINERKRPVGHLPIVCSFEKQKSVGSSSQSY